MSKASFLSMQLARFDSLRDAGEIETEGRSGVLFCSVAADTRAAASDADSQQAFVFFIFGLHESATSAHQLLDDRRALAPWMEEAREAWCAVLQPTRHKGAANYLDRSRPGQLFAALAPPPVLDTPLVVITSAGWNTGDGLDMNRAREFSAGVMGVRASMTSVEGMHSQQAFRFPRGLEFDSVTVTFWRDEASMRAFAHGPGVHRLQVARDREQNLSDRTSFTRCTVLRSEGTWYGRDPLSWD